jgi:hypothetical protein
MSKLNYIFRSLLRHKLNSGVIILSLSIGIACICLIAVFISRELNTDKFHADNELIYVLKAVRLSLHTDQIELEKLFDAKKENIPIG